MLRDSFIQKGIAEKGGFRWRCHEVLRIEGLSDAVFAFAVTLLIVSLEVPRTFSELWETMQGFVPFALCFAMLAQLWFRQYVFFRRYGLQDMTSLVLNMTLLFVVLFFVYPLKFLASFLVSIFTGGGGKVRLPNGQIEEMLTGNQGATMMIVYGLGFVAVFGLLTLLYVHAYRKRLELELTAIEIFDTRNAIVANAINAVVGVISILIAWIGGAEYSALAGFTYMLIGIAQTAWGSMSGRKRRLHFEGPTKRAGR